MITCSNKLTLFILPFLNELINILVEVFLFVCLGFFSRTLKYNHIATIVQRSLRLKLWPNVYTNSLHYIRIINLCITLNLVMESYILFLMFSTCAGLFVICDHGQWGITVVEKVFSRSRLFRNGYNTFSLAAYVVFCR